MKEGNIINFPSPKNHGTKQKGRFNFKQKKIMALASLASILLIVTLLNRSLDPSAKTSGDTYTIDLSSSSKGRHVANVKKRDIVEQDQLAERLALPTRRVFASIGRKPTLRESFVYGDFAKYRNKYVIVFDEQNEHLVSMDYVSSSVNRDPSSEVFVSTPEAFFRSYKSIFPKGATQLILERETTKAFQSSKEKVYRLLDEQKKAIAEIKFTMGGDNGEYLYGYRMIK